MKYAIFVQYPRVFKHSDRMIQNEKEILQLLSEEIVPAEGCTEPIALAYAASLVTDALGGRIAEKMDVFLLNDRITDDQYSELMSMFKDIEA